MSGFWLFLVFCLAGRWSMADTPKGVIHPYTKPASSRFMVDGGWSMAIHQANSCRFAVDSIMASHPGSSVSSRWPAGMTSWAADAVAQIWPEWPAQAVLAPGSGG